MIAPSLAVRDRGLPRQQVFPPIQLDFIDPWLSPEGAGKRIAQVREVGPCSNHSAAEPATFLPFFFARRPGGAALAASARQVMPRRSAPGSNPAMELVLDPPERPQSHRKSVVTAVKPCNSLLIVLAIALVGSSMLPGQDKGPSRCQPSPRLVWWSQAGSNR